MKPLEVERCQRCLSLILPPDQPCGVCARLDSSLGDTPDLLAEALERHRQMIIRAHAQGGPGGATVPGDARLAAAAPEPGARPRRPLLGLTRGLRGTPTLGGLRRRHRTTKPT